jgi:hypothetical protein
MKTCKSCGGGVCEICGGCVNEGECACKQNEIDQLRAEVERLREAQRWIPVGERLPEKDKPILLIEVDYGVNIGKRWDEKYYFGYNEDGIGSMWGEATHWMPLPEPPEGDNA